MNLENLKDPFPSIHWRAQSVFSGNEKRPPAAMALPYIDARDVMDRLDDVCGPENWSDRFEERPSGRVYCTISINIPDHGWIGKTDAAGDTDVEGEKGAVSDALKRAGVKWGIGRYLYDMPTIWAECELKKGKFYRWTEKGLQHLRDNSSSVGKLNNQLDKDAKLAELTTLLQTAKVLPATVNDAYSVNQLSDLTPQQMDEAINRAHDIINNRKAA